MDREAPIEKILWSIVIPGFGLILNRQLFKGVLLLKVAIIINVMSHLNVDRKKLDSCNEK